MDPRRALYPGRWTVAISNGAPEVRSVRDSTFDASATFQPWQVVDVLALDAQGHLLAAGASFSFEGSLTNPVPYGLVRLLPAGTPIRASSVRRRGTFPVCGTGWNPGDWFAYTLESPKAGSDDVRQIQELGLVPPDHRLVRLPDGRFMGALDTTGGPLTRYCAVGSRTDAWTIFSWIRWCISVCVPPGDHSCGAPRRVRPGRRGGRPRRSADLGFAPGSDAHLETLDGLEVNSAPASSPNPGRRYQVLSQDSLNDP